MRKVIAVWWISLLAVLTGVSVYQQPVAVVVPHHNVVADLRLKVLRQVGQRRLVTRTVIILSPDHFSPHQREITYAETEWNLNNGKVEADKIMGERLNGEIKMINEVGTVRRDHGIFNILPDVKTVWPRAKVVTILVGQKVDEQRTNQLAKAITTECGWDCLVIVSVDFSHYLPRAMADVHDEVSMRTLQNQDERMAMSLEVDSPQSLAVMMKLAKARGAGRWQLAGHTNLGWLDNNRDEETTSHILGWYERGNQEPSSDQATTFLVARQLDKDTDSRGLGERFFYGTDWSEVNLNQQISVGGKLEFISGGDEKTVVSVEQNKIRVNLGEEMAVAGVINQQGGRLVFLPMKKGEAGQVLMRGEEKTNKIKEIGANNEGIVRW